MQNNSINLHVILMPLLTVNEILSSLAHLPFSLTPEGLLAPGLNGQPRDLLW